MLHSFEGVHMHPLIGVGNININFWCHIPIWKGYSCNPFFHSGNKKTSLFTVE